MEVKLDEVVVGDRVRRGVGDVASLAASIEDLGLLQPIVITSDKRLICGARRLAACRQLGWAEIPATVRGG